MNQNSNFLEVRDFFQDHCVLQRGRVNPLSGRTAPDTIVHATIGKYESWGRSDERGDFDFFLPPMEAAEGLTLRIEAGDQSVEFSDVAIGELYLLSGQSNMEFRLRDNIPSMDELPPADFNGIRHISIPARTFHGKRHDLGGAKWRVASPETTGLFSALGFFFARKLHRETGVTVGLVDISLGGMPVETWVSRASLLTIPELRDEVLAYDLFTASLGEAETLHPGDKVHTQIPASLTSLPDDFGEGEGYEMPECQDDAWDAMYLPDNWTQAGHIHAGVFWFRRTVELPAGCDDAWELHLGCIDKGDKSFVNGVKVGETGGPLEMSGRSIERVYAIPAGILHAGRNVLAVKASSYVSILEDGGLIGPAEEMYLLNKAGGARIPLEGDWKYKEVYDAGTLGMTYMRTLGVGAPQSFHILYDNQIVPMRDLPFAGVLFYQGECNAICEAPLYERLLGLMIDDLRHVFGNLELPFILVQLPDLGPGRLFGPHSQWALIREAQANVSRTKKNVSCLVTLGTNDGKELHPVNKIPLGEWCSDIVLKGERCPFISSVKPEGASLLATFDAALDRTEAPCGFLLAGEDDVACEAQAEFLTDTTIRVWSEKVPSPQKIWYAWADHPQFANIKGINGMMASPFRK
ncbi:MAG: sialate O-acetylesterase [Lentisphaeria bacterium]|nr:sialate O-acetylesterase [Lentisphaeria bacterium]